MKMILIPLFLAITSTVSLSAIAMAPAAIVERVEYHVAYINNVSRSVQGKSAHKRYLSDTELYDLLQGLTTYKDAMVKQCIVAIRKEQSLQPFFDMWNNFKKEHHSNNYQGADVPFLKECSELIFTFYNNMMSQLMDEKRLHRVTVTEIIEIYNAIAALPIEELLNLLDQIVEQIMKILEDHHIQPGDSLFGWLEKNWWLPPVIVSGLLSAVITI